MPQPFYPTLPLPRTVSDDKLVSMADGAGGERMQKLIHDTLLKNLVVPMLMLQ